MSAKIKNNILETIGHTPMIRLNSVAQGIQATVLAKVETFNPGHSIKDRMAVKMIDDAEASGKLLPGGTIIECTSGNTGMGLALVACVRGYKCIFTTSDKQSKEKIDMLKAMGAEVIVCPTNVDPTDPRSYYSVAEKLSKEINNSFWCNQYDNLSNGQAHYESTGPEIWDQTDGKITHLVVGVGTGGTISGTARYLKEKIPPSEYGASIPLGVFSRNITKPVFLMKRRFTLTSPKELAKTSFPRMLISHSLIFSRKSAIRMPHSLREGWHVKKAYYLVILQDQHSLVFISLKINSNLKTPSCSSFMTTDPVMLEKSTMTTGCVSVDFWNPSSKCVTWWRLKKTKASIPSHRIRDFETYLP
ncbi:MAG: pyridoxal-phosphate dependent enzyme [Saprospiraceae bacterium]